MRVSRVVAEMCLFEVLLPGRRSPAKGAGQKRDNYRRVRDIAKGIKVRCRTMAKTCIASIMLAIAATITLLGVAAAAEPAQHYESTVGSPDNLKKLKHGLVEKYPPRTHCRIHLNCPHRRQTPAPPPTHWM